MRGGCLKGHDLSCKQIGLRRARDRPECLRLAAAETIGSVWILVKLGTAVATESHGVDGVVGWIARQAHARSLVAWCLDLVGDLSDADMVGQARRPVHQD